jgi:hypothetical protein
MQPRPKVWQAKNCNIFLSDEIMVQVSNFRPFQSLPNTERLIPETSGAHLAKAKSHLIIKRLFAQCRLLQKGRVAESGLRHSTRNRAWGNPPWVRIPPLPPSCFARCFAGMAAGIGAIKDMPSHIGGGEIRKSDA